MSKVFWKQEIKVVSLPELCTGLYRHTWFPYVVLMHAAANMAATLCQTLCEITCLNFFSGGGGQHASRPH